MHRLSYRLGFSQALLLVGLCLLAACPKQAPTSNTPASSTTVSSSGQNEYTSPFKIESFPLSSDYWLGDGRVLTSEQNTFAGIDIMQEKQQACKIQLLPRGIEPIMNVSTKLDGRKTVAMFFPDRRVLVAVKPLGDEAPAILVIDTESGMELDVTPANLGSLWKRGTELSLVGWTGKHGLCLYASGQRDDELVLWQGHNTLAEVQRIPATVATGSRMTDEGLQFLAVNSSIELLAFDNVEGKLIADPDGIDLAASIADELGNTAGSPARFAAANGIAVLQTRDGSHWAVLGDADQQDYLEVHDAAGITPEGRRRLPGPADVINGTEIQRLRAEGVQQAASVINEGFVLPVNTNCVGIFDQVYQRLILFSLPQ